MERSSYLHLFMMRWKSELPLEQWLKESSNMFIINFKDYIVNVLLTYPNDSLRKGPCFSFRKRRATRCRNRFCLDKASIRVPQTKACSKRIWFLKNGSIKIAFQEVVIGRIPWYMLARISVDPRWWCCLNLRPLREMLYCQRASACWRDICFFPKSYVTVLWDFNTKTM